MPTRPGPERLRVALPVSAPEQINADAERRGGERDQDPAPGRNAVRVVLAP